ncbi:MAG: cytochrome c4 [Rhodocyclaceae bacterium]|nr:cytochrome c4 [Rhodocyclaceae bacterium]
MGYKHTLLTFLLAAAPLAGAIAQNADAPAAAEPPVAAQAPAADAAAAPAAAVPATAAICAACHNMDGNSAVPDYPKLAGHHPEYLLKQLRDFKPVGDKPALRDNAIMFGMIAALSDEDMVELANYFAAQTPTIGEAKPETLELGKSIWQGGIPAKGVPACAGCHGANGSGMPVQYPRLSGQHPEYVVAQILAFQTGTRKNDLNGVMQDIAQRLTPAEMQAVANAIAGLH